jgi:TRAP-type C4-dicarboxylate transport system permease small subunit
MAFVLILNVIFRFLGNSLSFAEELGQFTLIFVTFIGMSYATRKGSHIRMTGLLEVLPEKVKKVIMIIVSFSTGLITMFLSYHSIRYIQKMKELNTVSPALRIPLYLIYIAVFIGFTLCSLEYFLNIIKNFKEEDVYVSRFKKDISELAIKEEDEQC